MRKILTLVLAFMLIAPAAALADDKVYELTLAWNDI